VKFLISRTGDLTCKNFLSAYETRPTVGKHMVPHGQDIMKLDRVLRI